MPLSSALLSANVYFSASLSEAFIRHQHVAGRNTGVTPTANEFWLRSTKTFLYRGKNYQLCSKSRIYHQSEEIKPQPSAITFGSEH